MNAEYNRVCKLAADRLKRIEYLVAAAKAHAELLDRVLKRFVAEGTRIDGLFKITTELEAAIKAAEGE